MADELIGEYRWRRRLRDWSAVCDNSMKLDRTDNLSGSPFRLNDLGICPPPCEMCVTPYGSLSPLVRSCPWPRVPVILSCSFNGVFEGFQPFSACVSALNSGFSARYFSSLPASKTCTWSSNPIHDIVTFNASYSNPTYPKCLVSNGVSRSVRLQGDEFSKQWIVVIEWSHLKNFPSGNNAPPSQAVSVIYRLNIGDSAPFGTFNLPLSQIGPSEFYDRLDTYLLADVFSAPTSITISTNPAEDTE